MNQEELENKVTKLGATISQQSDSLAQVLKFMEELKQQRPQPPPGFPPPGFEPPPHENNGEEDWVQGVPPFAYEKKLQEKMDKVDKLESVLRKSKGIDDYMLDLEGLFEPVKLRLPENFKMPAIDRFDGTGNPKSHVKLCMSIFQSMGCTHEHIAMLFPQTLAKSALSWFLTLEASKTRAWEDIVRVFVDHYSYNQELDVTIRDLETTRQNFNESFAAFLSRWRNKVAQMIHRPVEKEQVRMLIKNLQPLYHEKLFYQSISTFEELFEIGTRIEDAIREGKIKNEESQRQSKRPDYSRNRSDVNALSNQPTAYSPQPYQLTSQTSSPSRPYQNRVPREFSKLDISPSVALGRLLKKGHLQLLQPRADSPPPNCDLSKQCAYHQGPGHDTDRCIRLRHDIQDLIDRRIIEPPPIQPHVT